MMDLVEKILSVLHEELWLGYEGEIQGQRDAAERIAELVKEKS